MNTLNKYVLLSLLCFVSLNIKAQSFRLIDLGARMIAPDSGFQFVSPDSLEFRISVTNYGPDTVWAVDSLLVRSRISNNDPEYTYSTFPLKESILPGDSLEINYKVWCDVFAYTHFLSVSTNTALLNRNPLYFFQPEVVPLSNNNVCYVFIQNSNSLNHLNEDVFLLKQTLWPNPVQREFFLRIENFTPKGDMQFSLYNGLGQEQSFSFEVKEQGFYFQLPEGVASGTYFLKSVSGNASVQHKIFVQ